MPVQATAPGKAILFGEHAVVYGRPAIAVPVSQLRARAVVEASAHGVIRLVAPDLGTDRLFEEADAEDPLAATLRQLCLTAGLTRLPGMTLTVTSQIPIASGLGSGAAISAAVIRAVAQFLGRQDLLEDQLVSAITYEVEKIHHGTPSGIDNTVVSYERPVYFVRQQPSNRIEAFDVAVPLRLLVADTGVASSTRRVVEDVRRQWLADSRRFDSLFDACGHLAESARQAIERGDVDLVGSLMNRNHQLLQEMTVSSPELDLLTRAAVEAGALGAKMSGAGRGGNMVALVTEGMSDRVAGALRAAGARAVLSSMVASTI